MAKAVVVGSINRDIVAYVSLHPRPGETVLTSRGALFPGGKGANQAVAIARLGGRVEMFGRVGDDAFGAEMRAYLSAEGVEIGGIHTVPGALTGVALITVDRQGQNSIAVVAGANQHWGDDLSDFEVKVDDLVIGQLEVPMTVVTQAFEAAKEMGARTLLNAAPFVPLEPKLLANTDILVLNEIELAALAGIETTINHRDMARLNRLAAVVLASGPSLVVVTLGGEGVYLQGNGMTAICVPGERVEVRDSTGAGDCFVGAFVAQLLRGGSAYEAAVFANASAAVSVTREGAAASLPTRADVEQFMSNSGRDNRFDDRL